MSSTLERPLAWKKEIEEGSVLIVSTPTAGGPGAGDPRHQRRLELVGVGRAVPAPCPAAGRGRRSSRRGRRSCRCCARRSGRARPRAGCRRSRAGGRGPCRARSAGRGSSRRSAKRVFARSSASPLTSTGSRTTPTPTRSRPGRRQRLLDRGGDVARQAAEGDRSRSACLPAGRGSAPGRPVRRTRWRCRVRRSAARPASGRPRGCRRGCARGPCGCRSARRRRTRRRSGSRSPAPRRRRSARLRGSERCSPSTAEG